MLALSLILGLVSIILYRLCQNHYVWQSSDPFLSTSNISSENIYKERYSNHLNYKFFDVYIPFLNSKDHSVIHAWLLIPNNQNTDDKIDNKISLVLLAHGLGAQKDMGLLSYAESFADAGYASLIMDYRYFGGSHSKSSPKIRNWINPWNHIDDIKNVLYAIQNDDLYLTIAMNIKTNLLDTLLIDKTNIVLWGTSFAGGHMLQVTKELQEDVSSSITIKGIISQIPHLDGKAATKRALKTRGIVGTLRVLILSVVDIIISQYLGYSPIYVKIVGNSNDTSYMMLNNEEQKEYYTKHPQNYLGNWKNLSPARTMIMLSLYNPINNIIHIPITIPILFIAGSYDSLCPLEYIQKAISICNDKNHPVQLLEVNSTHFSVYRHKVVMDKMVTFLNDIYSNK